MPLILIVRFLLSLLSLAILALTGYFLWTWYQGEYLRDAYGVFHFAREPWRLGVAAGLLTWSFGGGGLVLRPFLAKADPQKIDFRCGDGEIVTGVNGASLYIETLGAPKLPSIILTHGWGLDSTIWAKTKRDLSQRFRVISWDLPSMGKSKAPVSAVSLESFADNLAQVIRYSGADRVVLVGHSIGGMVSQTLARDHPDFFAQHVAGVVLVNTTYHDPLKTMIMSKLALALKIPVVEPQMFLTMWLWPLAWLSAWKSYLDGTAHVANRLGFGAYVTHSQLDHTTLLSIRNSQQTQAKGNLAMFHWDATNALAKHSMPVLVLGGEADLLTRPRASQTIARSTSNGTVQIIEKVGHMGFLERSDIYNREIGRFAARALAEPSAAEAYR